jgi:hypothetical protein
MKLFFIVTIVEIHMLILNVGVCLNVQNFFVYKAFKIHQIVTILLDPML